VPRLLLKLYVTGGTPRAEAAVANLRRICEETIPDEYELVVIDVLEQPHLAEQDHVLVTPTVVRQLPLPSRRVLGDLSNSDLVLSGLQLLP
jgi:circadian clock protein KaiB